MSYRLHKLAVIAAVFVPLMGATSVYFGLAMFHPVAIITGVCVFIVQWAWVFHSARFQRFWQLNLFKVAFILNAVVRIPLSLYLDPLMFFYLCAGLDHSGIWPGLLHAIDHPDRSGFLDTLLLTLLHGVAVQLAFAATLGFIYGLCNVIQRVFWRRRNHA